MLHAAGPSMFPSFQSFSDGRFFVPRDNVLVRRGSTAEYTEHSLQAHAGPTDLDVAMFHRDAGAVGAQGQGGGARGVVFMIFFCPKMGAVANWVGQTPVRSLPQKAPIHWLSKPTSDPVHP